MSVMNGGLKEPTNEHPPRLANGKRVRHSGQRYPKAINEGTANIVDAVPMIDRTWEYHVEKDDGSYSWWASYRTIEVER